MKCKRLTALLLCVGIAASALPASLAWLDGVNWTWGTISGASETTVAPETVYRSISAASPVGPQKIHAIQFNPKNPYMQLRAGKSHGNVYGVQTVLGITNEMDEKFPGQVVAGVNGDFFDLGVGVPFGIFLDEGRILSSPPQYSSTFGIKEDGTPFVMTHGSILNKTLYIGDKGFELTGINNRIKDANSLMMYTEDYGSSTRVKADSIEVICSVVSGEPKHGETMTLKVNSFRKGMGNAPLGKGLVVLSATGSRMNDIAYLAAGYEITVKLSFSQFWQDVKFAIGGNYTLLKDGVVQNVSDGSRNPRTVIGHKADGTVVFYTIDGRQSGYSAGATLAQAATIMRDLGCTDALNLDGGGSTTFVLRPLGSMTRSVINSPSEGSQRQVANAVVLLNTAPAQDATALIIKETGRKVLAGGSYSYSLFGAVDKNLQPRPATGPFTWSVTPEIASISADGVLKTSATQGGTIQVTVSNGAAAGATSAEIVDQITQITSQVSSLILNPNEEASVEVTTLRDSQTVEHTASTLTWAVDSWVGTMTAPGKIKAGSLYAMGNLYVSYKDVTLKIPVTVNGPKPQEKFSDLGSFTWAKDAIYRLVDEDIIHGVTEHTFAPSKSITRADFMLLLVRMMGIDTSAEPVDNFRDVPKDAYYYKEIGAAKALGIAHGVTDYDFAPERSITREEMFTLVERVMKQMGYLTEDASLTALNSYTDAVSISGYARQPIATLSFLNLIQGDEASRVNPQKAANRAEAAVFIDRVNTDIKTQQQEQQDQENQQSSAETNTETGEESN